MKSTRNYRKKEVSRVTTFKSLRPDPFKNRASMENCIAMLVGLCLLSLPPNTFAQSATPLQPVLVGDALSSFYDTAKAQTVNFPLPTTEATVDVGTIDMTEVRQEDRSWIYPSFRYLIDTYTDGSFYTTSRPAVDDELPHHGNSTPALVTRHANKGGNLTVANIEHLHLRFSVQNWTAPDTSITVQVGSKFKNIAQGTTEVIISDVADTNPMVVITTHGMTKVNNIPNDTPIPGILPLKIEWKLVGAGVFTLPVLPVAMIYSPVPDAGKLNKASIAITNSSGVSTTLSLSSSNGVTTPTPTSFQTMADVEKGMSALGAILSKIPNPYTVAIGTALNTLSSTLSSALGNSTATQTSSTSISDQKTLQLFQSGTITQTAFSNQGGPGVGDVIAFYTNARVIWYSEDGKMSLALLGFDRFQQVSAGSLTAALQALQQQPAGAVDPKFGLETASIQSLLALDPFVAGGPSASLPPSRFVPMFDGSAIEMNAGTFSPNFTKTLTNSELQSTTTLQSRIQTDSPGFLAFIGLGVTDAQTVQVQVGQSRSTQTSLSQTFDRTFTLNSNGTEAYSCKIYLDVVFGSFAFQLVPNAGAVRLSGRLFNQNGIHIANSVVTASALQQKYITVTDSNGAFQLRLPGLGVGHIFVSSAVEDLGLNLFSTEATNEGQVQFELRSKPVSDIVVQQR